MLTYQFRLSTLLKTVAAVAVVLGTLHYPRVAYLTVRAVWLLVLVAGVCGSLYGHGKWRAYWLGFTLIWSLVALNEQPPFPMSYDAWARWVRADFLVVFHPGEGWWEAFGYYYWLTHVSIFSAAAGVVSTLTYVRLNPEQEKPAPGRDGAGEASRTHEPSRR